MSAAPVLAHEPWTALPGLRHGFLPGHGEPDVAVHTPRQVHGTVVAALAPDGPRPDADGLATDRAGAFVGVVTADCVPLLLVAPRRRVVAAVHAGWRGAAAGVVEAALARLRDTFDIEPRDVGAAIGPAIGACCYEVGPEVRAAFVARTGETTACAWGRERGRDRLDLRAAVAALLVAAGVRDVATLGPCTRCSRDYCSYRRDGAAAGRQVSFIGWA